MADHRRRTTLKGTYVVDEGTRILAGRYEVGELIGRGGMAEVHIGHDRRLGRTVAIKILRSDLARDPSFQNRFRREAQAAASLNHPAIVAVYDTGEDVVTEPTGLVAHVPFIVMEYVEGRPLGSVLEEDIRRYGAMPADQALKVTADVLAVGNGTASPEQRFADWEQKNAPILGRARTTLEEIRSSDAFDLANLSVAMRTMRTLLRTHS